ETQVPVGAVELSEPGGIDDDGRTRIHGDGQLPAVGTERRTAKAGLPLDRPEEPPDASGVDVPHRDRVIRRGDREQSAVAVQADHPRAGSDAAQLLALFSIPEEHGATIAQPSQPVAGARPG